MSILCAIDFSEPSLAAATVASLIAAKQKLPLHLVHAIDLPGHAFKPAEPGSLAAIAAEQLEREAERLRAAGVSVECHLRPGTPDEVILQLAKELSVQLMVLGALGERRGSERPLGSHADRTAELAHVPVLVVRNAKPFEEWLSGLRPLRIALGVDATLSSQAAGNWVLDLAQLGQCEVVLTHLYWPPEELHRLGLGGLRTWEDSDADVERALRHEYGQRFAALFDAAKVSYRMASHLGRTGDGLASFAAEEHADLVVVGCHERGPLARLWHGSVSRQALRCAAMSVALVPAPREAAAHATPSIRNVLVATDFSEIGNASVPLAYAAVGYGGTVHLVHVLEMGRDPTDAYDVFIPSGKIDAAALTQKRAQLAALVPKDFSGAAAATRLHILEAPRASDAICQAAERLGVDLICLGTHARSGLGRAVLGSVAASVLEQTRRPVLLSRGPLE